MAGSGYSWSTVFADNGTADGDVPWPEGMARRQVNDSARGIMGRVAELLGDLGGALSAGGTANGLTVTANSAFTTLANGRIVAFRATADNTGAATLNVNSIGAKAIRKMDSTGDVALVAGEIQSLGIYLAMYSEALNAAAGAWLLINPTIDLAGFVTLTGTQTLTNKTLTGAVLNGTLGATTPASVAGTTGTFSSTVTGDNFIGTSSGANLVMSTTGAGTARIRPNGVASAVGEVTISDTGAMTVNGTLTVVDGAIFQVSAAEIARVTSTAIHIGKNTGNLTAAGTSFFASGVSNGLFQCTRDSDIVGQFNVINPVGTETILEFMTSGTAKGSITINGSTTAYNTTSDRRLKENPRSFDAGAIIDRLKVYQFDWKAGGSGYGVFAQEAVKAFPDAVTKGKGRKSWKVDYSKFVPLLIQEVKALREEVRRLKG